MYMYEILDECVSVCDAYGMPVYVMPGVCVSVWYECVQRRVFQGLGSACICDSR